MPLTDSRKAELARLDPPELRGVKLGINLYDLDRLQPIVKQTLLGGKLDFSGAVWVDRSRLDETAVVFNCPLLQAASIIDVIRAHDREAGDAPTRAYVFRRTWTKLSASAVLTKVEEGKCLLSAEVFGYDGSPTLTVAPVPKAVTVGKSLTRRNGRAKDQGNGSETDTALEGSPG